jgi:LuxR family maltose regulon positive regulatory protein
MSSQGTIPDRLIRTKFYPPRVSEQLIRRQKLIERLNHSLNQPVTLVSAAAGYGKSTLALQWLKANDYPFAWLSLDSYDSELDLFADYLIAALATVFPTIGKETVSLLTRAQSPSARQLGDSLLRDLRDLSQPVFLVLDDYHTIKNKDVHEFMMRLMRQQPADLHLVLLTRVDPPLDLARLRGQGQLQEIRGSDLSFKTEEAAGLLELIVNKPIDWETVSLLNKRTEGWPAGLRMAAMSMRAADDYRGFARRYITAGQKFVSDYLLNEVLSQLPDEQRLLLLRSSIVDRFCAPLLDELAADSIPGINSLEFLDQLYSANFFVVALDDHGTWYRYHHLFRQLLQQQLNLVSTYEEIAAINLQASAWFEDAGFIEDAVIHALQGGESERAGIIVENHVHGPINQENWRLTDRWISLLPEEVRQRPGLLATQAILEQLRYRLSLILPLLDEAEIGLKEDKYKYTPEQKKAWYGVINTFRATLFISSVTPQDALQYAEKALLQVDTTARYVYSLAELWRIYALQQTGNFQEAIRLSRHLLASRIGLPDVLTNRLMLAQCGAYYGEADVRGLSSSAASYLDLALRSGQQLSIAWANFLLGWSHYQANRLEEAKDHFRNVLEIGSAAHVRTVIDSITGLALIHSAHGEREEARVKADELRKFLIEQGALTLLPFAASLSVSLLDPDSKAIVSVDDFMIKYKEQLAADLYQLPVLTSCQCAIVSKDTDRLAVAEKILSDCRAFALFRNNKRQLIQIDILLALLYEQRGDSQRALDSLKTAVLLGEPGGALRYFVDLGPQLIPLLRKLHDQGTAPAYIQNILDAYSETGLMESFLPAAEATGTLSAEAVFIMGELTNREIEVLRLLGRRLTNKEIAKQLHVSPNTIKKYSIGVYSKLEVDNRRQAVARAIELGIIPNP